MLMESRKFIIACVLAFFCFTGCEKKEVRKISNDFTSLMGSHLDAWKYVQTKEDFSNLEFFKSVYEKNIAHLKDSTQELKIP